MPDHLLPVAANSADPGALLITRAVVSGCRRVASIIVGPPTGPMLSLLALPAISSDCILPFLGNTLTGVTSYMIKGPLVVMRPRETAVYFWSGSASLKSPPEAIQ